MPHVSSSGGDDLCSTDEVKVFKDEGDGEDEKRSSENLTEEKSSLIDLTESEVQTRSGPRDYSGAVRRGQTKSARLAGKNGPSAHAGDNDVTSTRRRRTESVLQNISL